ncbi:hypothetical protein C4D60_Mb09t13100 [Musa balbisiana]|uniref:Uncharacterized protein n=1 Tax=Musa balbisiana TaxID=52838 RepID=A0A4S8IG10_MUSBA|nr:hypothetical protein C4D60_Mb09t13100 [Musa balbisiana]
MSSWKRRSNSIESLLSSRASYARIFIPNASHSVLSCAPTHCTYDVVVQLSLTHVSLLLFVASSSPIS